MLEKVNELKHLTRYGGALRFDRSGKLIRRKQGLVVLSRAADIQKITIFHQSGISSLILVSIPIGWRLVARMG